MLFSWTNWISSVETKYLVLITNIYKFCKESHVESDECSNNGTENSKERFIITRDYSGDPMIPKKLYNLVREELLPYDRILFHYFQVVVFMAIFAYILYILLSLAQTSEISGSVQVIGTIAATSIPFIFNFVWKRKSDEQKEADSAVLISKLNCILLVCNRNDKTEKIDIEVRHTENNDDTKNNDDTAHTEDTKNAEYSKDTIRSRELKTLTHAANSIGTASRNDIIKDSLPAIRN